VLDHLAHRGVEPAGGVDLQDDELGLVFRGARERAAHEVRARRADRAFHRDDQHGRGLRKQLAGEEYS
jgi:hypothetical protein